MNKCILPLIVFLLFFLSCITEKVGLVAQTNQNAAKQKNNPTINRLQNGKFYTVKVNSNGWEFLSWEMKKKDVAKILEENKNEFTRTTALDACFNYQGIEYMALLRQE
ncbi:MAG: hypothetical protein U9N51_10940 [Bacteroidota bacterium]|nr:hypothetical protein [Bacteroidota bacterium]